MKTAFATIFIAFYICFFTYAETITIAHQKNYPPYASIGKTGEPEGVLIDWWKLWATKTSTDIKFVSGTSDECVEMVLNDEADVLAGTIILKDSLNLKYSEYILSVNTVLFLKKGIKPQSVHAIKDSIGVIKDELSHRLIMEMFPDLKLMIFNTIEDLRIEIANKSIIGFVYEMPNPFSKEVVFSIPNGYYNFHVLRSSKIRPAVKFGNEDIIQKILIGSAEISNEELIEIAKRHNLYKLKNNYSWLIAILAILVFSSVIIFVFQKRKSQKQARQIADYASKDWQTIINKGENDKIEFKKFKVYVVDLETEEIIREQKNLGIEIRGIELDKISDSLDLFMLNTDAAVIEFPKQEFNLPGGYYKLGFKHLKITPADSLIVLKGLKLKTTYSDKYEMAKKLHFTSEIFDIDLEELRVINLDFGKAVREGSIYIDTVLVSGLNLSLLMDKRLPFNEAKHPKLPNQLVKGLKFPLYVDHIIIENSELVYQEKMPDHEKPMTAILGDLYVHIRRATSIRDSIMTRKPMTMNLKSKLMKKPWMEVDFVFPLYRANDTFFYSGQLAGAKLSIFNDAAFPAIGVKFIDGHLDGITFKGSANPYFSKGEFTMLYTNLKAEVIKKDQVSKNKFATWAANAALRNANPGKNGTTRVAEMEFERVIYKGFGNIVWKTLQSGITNTISPVGKNVKEDKSKKKAQKKADDPEQKQKKKKKKRDKKK